MIDVAVDYDFRLNFDIRMMILPLTLSVLPLVLVIGGRETFLKMGVASPFTTFSLLFLMSNHGYGGSAILTSAIASITSLTISLMMLQNGDYKSNNGDYVVLTIFTVFYFIFFYCVLNMVIFSYCNTVVHNSSFWI